MSWVTVGGVDDVARRKKVVVEVEGYEVFVLAHDGEFYAFQNRCIHKQRELAKGVVLNGKLVCPGHQWAFALGSGYEAIKDECQPTFPVRVSDGVVEVDVTVPEGGPIVVATETPIAAPMPSGDVPAPAADPVP